MVSRARNVGDYVRFNSALPPRLSEFVILITARHWTQQFEWAAHVGIAERAGSRSGDHRGGGPVRGKMESLTRSESSGTTRCSRW